MLEGTRRHGTHDVVESVCAPVESVEREYESIIANVQVGGVDALFLDSQREKYIFVDSGVFNLETSRQEIGYDHVLDGLRARDAQRGKVRVTVLELR